MQYFSYFFVNTHILYKQKLQCFDDDHQENKGFVPHSHTW